MEHEKSIGKVIEKILLLRTRKYPYTFSSKLNILIPLASIKMLQTSEHVFRCCSKCKCSCHAAAKWAPGILTGSWLNRASEYLSGIYIPRKIRSKIRIDSQKIFLLHFMIKTVFLRLLLSRPPFLYFRLFYACIRQTYCRGRIRTVAFWCGEAVFKKWSQVFAYWIWLY